MACSSGVGVDRAPVARVTITPSSATVALGSLITFQATVEDADGHALTDRQVFWASNDSTVVAVDSITGVVRAVRLGTAQIAASSEGAFALATVLVSPIPVSAVAVLPGQVQVRTGATIQLRAVAYDTQGNELPGRAILWASSAPEVATVDVDGRVTGVAAGDATISATSEGKTGTANVNVTPLAVGSVTVEPSSASVVIGRTVQLTAVVRDERGAQLDDRAVVWSSGDERVATVSPTGLVTGVAAGTVEIRATSEGRVGVALITVTPPPVASVTVEPPSVSLFPAQTATLTATVRDDEGRRLTDRLVVWSSSNPTVATVSQDGTVTAQAPGTATITATSEGKSGTAAVSVLRVPVARVEVSPPSVTLQPGSTQLFTARTFDADGNELFGRVIVWESSNTDVITIDPGGFAMALEEGRAIITARSEGQSGEAHVRVRAQ